MPFQNLHLLESPNGAAPVCRCNVFRCIIRRTFWKGNVQYLRMEIDRTPKAVAVIAGFLFVATLIAVVVGSSLIFPGKLLDWLSQFNKPGMAAIQRLKSVFGVSLLALAVGTVVTGIGLLRRQRWAWYFAVILFIVNGFGDLVSFFLTRDAVRSFFGVAICSAFLYALVRPSTRCYFNTSSGPNHRGPQTSTFGPSQNGICGN